MVLHRLPLRSFLCGLTLAACLLLPETDPARAADKNDVTLILRGDESPDTMQKVMSAAEKAGKPVTVKLSSPDEKKSDGASVADAPPPASTLDLVVNNVVDGFDAGNRAIPAVVEFPEDWRRAWAEVRNGQQGPSAFLRLFGVFAFGLLAALLAHAMTRHWVAIHRVPVDSSPSRRFLASAAVLLRDTFLLVALLTATRAGIRYFLPEDDLVHEIAHRASIAVGGIGAYMIVGRFLLAPNEKPRRLLPLPRDEFHYKLLLGYGTLGPVFLGIIAVLDSITTNRDAVSGVFTIGSALITLYKLVWFWLGRHDFQQLVLSGVRVAGERPGLVHRILAFLTPYLLMASAICIWIIGRAGAIMADGDAWGHAAGLTQWMVISLPICAYGAGAVTCCFLHHRLKDNDNSSPLLIATADTLRSLSTGIVWILGIILLIWVWGNLLIDINASMQNGSIRQAIAVVTVAFCGWMAWRFLKNLFAAITPPPMATVPVPTAEDDAPHEEYVPSRLATILPALRGVVLACVVGPTFLICLSKLGVDISPLIAGFGIMGLAVSFGSQALVRDIVSGFFFIMEDAFRVGEYVDTGKLKGTVEKISLRSMQLRHQSGLVHVIPFGQLTSVTNASRDWATVKFNLRLDHSADIEKARKTIKRIGTAMLDDPEFGKDIIAPLKMQGVNEISENAIVVRLKFTAKPEYASAVQRLALRRVHDGLIEAGVPFASNQVTVRGSDNASAAAAYAGQAALRPAAE
ncbi:mechanosensitive ion channel family protein [Methylovirgula sp. 4M-Z18]|uniref:mechanosensitive ion channel family protein n=1 Tax=Methylovirgula sp. 4M-Z18 TaxID=2293567 RepID=UPI001313D952|nr:mechanosensitive ion channel family protein [Methylovirgula sp. 4M-Z18]